MIITGTVGFGFVTRSGRLLTSHEQEAFTDAVRFAVADVNGQVIFVGTGQGVWEGHGEPAACVVFQIEGSPQTWVKKDELRSFDFTNGAYNFLVNRLSDIRQAFDQDAIALTLGVTQIIPGINPPQDGPGHDYWLHELRDVANSDRNGFHSQSLTDAAAFERHHNKWAYR